MELDNLKEMVHIAKQKQREVIEIYDPCVLYVLTNRWIRTHIGTWRERVGAG